MKNIMILGLVALLLFSVSASLSLWLNMPKTAGTEEAQAEKPAAKKKAKEKADDDAKDAADKPAVIKPKGHAEVDATAQMAEQLRNKEAGLKQREEQIAQRKVHLETVLDDIRRDRAALDALQKQLIAESKSLGERIADFDTRAADIDKRKRDVEEKAASLKKNQLEYDDSESKRMKGPAKISDAMPPEQTAKIIQQMADSGKLDTAVKLLAAMKEAQAAKVLSDMNDPALAAQLLERLQSIKRTTAAANPTTP